MLNPLVNVDLLVMSYGDIWVVAACKANEEFLTASHCKISQLFEVAEGISNVIFGTLVKCIDVANKALPAGQM
jgi:hypothetical protein